MIVSFCTYLLKSSLEFLIKPKVAEMPQTKTQKMEDILGNKPEQLDQNKKPSKNAKEKKKLKETKSVIPKGKPKSGRIWKSEKSKFSSIIKTRGIRISFEKKQALKEQLKRVKDLSNSIKAARDEKKELRKQRRRENLKRQEENRKKSEIVQVITNTKKLKKIKRKHLRSVEKRDTTQVSK